MGIKYFGSFPSSVMISEDMCKKYLLCAKFLKLLLNKKLMQEKSENPILWSNNNQLPVMPFNNCLYCLGQFSAENILTGIIAKASWLL
jgi:hypothetical protein